MYMLVLFLNYVTEMFVNTSQAKKSKRAFLLFSYVGVNVTSHLRDCLQLFIANVHLLRNYLLFSSNR